MARRKKLTPAIIKKLVREERQRLNETLELGLTNSADVHKKVREVDAAKYAGTLEKCINHYKACKLKEAKLRRELKKIQETKRKLKNRLLKNLD
tara:strand:+ start:79 stop:360 length:282 start_codon:yes stop_codon:yes gene_type:complete